jgi:hypothetical protein
MPKSKVLNNFVTELLNLKRCEPGRAYRFANPRDGWVFISAAAAAAATLDGATIALDSGEAMRYLAAGEHRVAVSGKAAPLLVRAVPEIIYCKFPASPHVAEYGPYDWTFLSKYILPHINTIVGAGDEASRPDAEQWKARGGKWIVECGLPGLSAESVTADEAYDYWAKNPGLADPLLDGIIIDEFGGAISLREFNKYRAWTEAVERLARDGKLRGKSFYPYCTELYRYEASRRFAEAAIGAGGGLPFERYLREQSSEEEDQAFLNHMLANEMHLWRRVIPGSEAHLIICLGDLCAPPESLDGNPAADYKVHTEMQFQTLATRPECAGVYGVMEYTSSYADEEYLRWIGRLYRHYCIEGHTNRLSQDPYMLPHLQNPDFDAGADGWTLSPAEPGSIEVKHFEGYGWLEGRYPPSRMGDNFLVMKRSAAKPNTFSQTIKALQPGRLYSLRMYTGDYGELTSGKSTQQKHAVSIEIAGAEVLRDKSIQHVFPNCYSHNKGPFDSANNLWMNFHRLLFRATSPTATLTISDWAAPTDPGGPAGQQLIFNFIQAQPYLAE